MTSFLNALTSAAFTSTPRARRAGHAGEIEYQSVFAATAVLLAGGVAVILVALTQAF